jgi:3-deoxy-manno-octulosonate cytidylyltransferase (CMP-KDO synthetase)
MDFFKRELDAVGIVPARLASERFPNKLLADLCGIPVFVHTVKNIQSSKYLKEIIVATEDDEIIDVCEKFDINYIKTPNNFISGTDRIAWAVRRLEYNFDLVYNIQADEPLIDAETIDILHERFTNSLSQVGTLIKRIDNIDEVFNENIVKVVLETDNTALYFSRSPIPYQRGVEKEKWLNNQIYWKHIGVYCYKVESLERFVSIQPTDLEVSEKLEQLRLLQNNHKYFCCETNKEFIGIDTKEDLIKAENYLKNLK